MNLNTVNNFFGKLAEGILKYRFFVLVGVLAVVVFFAVRIPKMKIITSFESFFVEDDPALVTYDDFKKEFGNDKSVYVLVEPKKGKLFTMDNMKILQALTGDIERNLSHLDEVTSITNVEFIEGRDDTLFVHDLMENFPTTSDELQDIKKKVLDRPVYRDSIISGDGETTGILIRLKLVPDDPDYEIKIAKEIRSIFKNEKYRAFNFHEVGAVLFDTEFQSNVKSETVKFFRLSVLLIMIVVFLFIRKLYAVYIPLAVVITSAVMTFGLLAMTTAMKVTCSVIPPLIVTIGVCDSIYIISIFRKNRQNQENVKKAIIQTMEKCGLPCLITTITTIMGFIALSFVPVVPVREAGLFCAFGTAACFLMTITLGIILLSFGKNGPAVVKASSDKGANNGEGGGDIYHRIMGKVAYINIKAKYPILAIGALLVLVSIYLASSIKIDNDFLAYMGDKFEVKKDIIYVDGQMGGSSTFELVFDTGKKDGVKNIKVLREIEKVEQFAENDRDVMAVSSVVDIIKTINKTLHNENNDYYILPEQQDAAAQYLFLYESSGGDRLDKVLNFDYSEARLVVRTKTLSSAKALELFNRLTNFIDRNVTESGVIITGANALKVGFLEFILNAQVNSVIFAFSMITIMMIIVFQSIRTGLIAMIPNIIPLILILGFMGITGRKLGMLNAMISAIIIGIAVDDTIHFFSHYRSVRRKTKDEEKALYITLEEVGRPMFFTSIALVTGFSVVSFSSMNNVADFGVLTSLAVFLSLLSDFFIGSSLILTLKPFKGEALK
ncbi:MAG: MMPL family transporter [Desulfosarcina sp.]|nr:MMPL family transporter [Desulfobacterales bacterium]